MSLYANFREGSGNHLIESDDERDRREEEEDEEYERRREEQVTCREA